MKRIYIIIRFTLSLLLGVVLFSCHNLTDLNDNPNGITPNTANPNLILSTLTTEMPKLYLNTGYGLASGIVQHTQLDAWASAHNNYDYINIEWSGYYTLLVNNQLMYKLAEENNFDFHKGVSLIIRAFLYGQVIDMWGDAPYSQALQGDGAYMMPKYDSQEAVYQGIIEDLKEARVLLSQTSYEGINVSTDLIYKGDPAKWKKFANSLLLRYYMRISNKKDVKADFLDVVNNHEVFANNGDDATLAFLGNTADDSWPNAVKFDATQTFFLRIRPCATIVEQMRKTGDPRIKVWFRKVDIPTQLSTTQPHNTIVGGVHYLNPNDPDLINNADNYNTNQDYVGLPPGLEIPAAFNFHEPPSQQHDNKFVSYLADRYKEASGNLLKARLMSYSEVCFLLAEAANKGWLSNGKSHYENAIRASLDTWEVGADYDAFIAQANVVYNGTLEQLITQKWVASWTMSQEAWCDYRRTGIPNLKAGPRARRSVIPLRFPYGNNELSFNKKNSTEAITGLEKTNYSQGQENTSWCKFWLLKGSNIPFYRLFSDL